MFIIFWKQNGNFKIVHKACSILVWSKQGSVPLTCNFCSILHNSYTLVLFSIVGLTYFHTRDNCRGVATMIPEQQLGWTVILTNCLSLPDSTWMKLLHLLFRWMTELDSIIDLVILIEFEILVSPIPLRQYFDLKLTMTPSNPVTNMLILFMYLLQDQKSYL